MAAITGAAILVIVAVLVVVRLVQSTGDAPAPITAEKRAQLRALDALSDRDAGLLPKANPQARDPGLRDSGRKGVGLSLRNTFFRIAGDVGFDAERLSALLVPNNPAEPVILDDPGSFVFKPLQGRVTMPPSGLTALFNQYLTAYPGSRMRALRVTTESGKLIVDGEVSQVPGVWLPFHMEGEVRLRDKHLVEYKPDKIEIADIGARGLLKTINLQLGNLVGIETGGARISGNRIVLDLDHALPPPTQDIRVAEMQLDKQGLHLTFTSGSDPEPPEPIVESDSYALLQGGDIKTMRILLTDVRLQMVARDGERLNVSLYNYRQQLRDGVLTATPGGGFVVYLGAHRPADYVPHSDAGEGGQPDGGDTPAYKQAPEDGDA